MLPYYLQANRRRRANVGRKGGVPPITSPLDIANLKVWYDFSDATTMFTDTSGVTPVALDNQTIARINDKSGNGYYAIQATSFDRPRYRTNVKNSNSCAQFTINSSMSTAASVSTFVAKRGCLFCVADGDGDEMPLIGTRPTFPGWTAYMDTTFRYSFLRADNYDLPYYSTDPTLSNTFYIQAWHRTSDTEIIGWQNTLSFQIDLINETQPAANVLHIGHIPFATNRLNGRLAEIVLYDDISAIDVQRVITYLNTKWAIY